MSNISIQRQIGSIMIVTGTEIGAGILALPIITAQLGFITATIIMLASWVIMTYTAILIADISLKMPKGSSFASMAKKVLGLPGAIIAWLSFIILLYAISIAYISAASSAFNQIANIIPQNAWALIFVVAFCGIVIMGTSAVDIINRILLTTKLVFLVIVCFFLLRLIHPSYLSIAPVDSKVFFIAIPVIITSFTSHLIIPTLSDYLDRNAKILFRVILIGSLIPLFFYFLWLASVLGILPLHGKISFMSSIFNHHTEASANIGDVLNALHQMIKGNLVSFSVNVFTVISVMTSYLGVSLALYHFNIDSYRLNKLSIKFKVFFAILLTFIFPLLVIQIYPNLFVPALGYVGVCVAILLIILPSIMAFKLHANGHTFSYRINTIPIIWAICIFAGIAIIILKFI